jgi:hypothetical protein
MKGAAMRFQAATQPKQPLRKAPAGESIRQLVTGNGAPAPKPAPARPDELPAALDERVRLIGEW